MVGNTTVERNKKMYVIYSSSNPTLQQIHTRKLGEIIVVNHRRAVSAAGEKSIFIADFAKGQRVDLVPTERLQKIH